MRRGASRFCDAAAALKGGLERTARGFVLLIPKGNSSGGVLDRAATDVAAQLGVQVTLVIDLEDECHSISLGSSGAISNLLARWARRIHRGGRLSAKYASAALRPATVGTAFPQKTREWNKPRVPMSERLRRVPT